MSVRRMSPVRQHDMGLGLGAAVGPPLEYLGGVGVGGLPPSNAIPPQPPQPSLLEIIQQTRVTNGAALDGTPYGSPIRTAQLSPMRYVSHAFD